MRNDPLKQAIANFVQDGLRLENWRESKHLKNQTNIAYISVMEVTPLSVFLRVKLEKGGSRYFMVKVSEVM